MELLTPDVGLIFWTTVTFLLLVFLLGKFAWKPILKALEEREQRIRQAIEEAERLRADAQQHLEEQKRRLAAAHETTLRLIEEGKEKAEQVGAELLEKAQREAEAQLARARREIELARTQAVDRIRREAADLALHAAARVLERAVDESENRRLAEEYVAELEGER